VSQAGVARLLAGASGVPGSLPQDALLVVRTLGDPLPGVLDPASRSPAPPERWQAAFRASLERELAGAARPASGFVPAGARAVVFADRAELLACLAADWCSGELATRWWWGVVLPGRDPGERVVPAWLDGAREAPRALDVLASRGLAGAFVARLTDAQASQLSRAIALTFGLAAVANEVGRSHPRAHGLPATTGSVRAPLRPAPPWAGHAPEATGTLGRERELLLGVALTLHRAPYPTRAVGFADALRRWAGAPAATAPPGRETQTTPQAAPLRSAAPERRATPAAAPAALQPRRTAPLVLPERADRQTPPGSPYALRTGTTGDSPDELELESSGAPRILPTRLGGLFTLVNVAQSIELYGDFTTPLAPGIALDLWDFVDLVGERLLGRRPPDPVWPLLGELAGRGSHEPPGRHFSAPRAWRAPPSWLEPFAPDRRSWRWTQDGSRLRVAHPAGFAVLDVSCRSADPRTVLARELRHYGALRVREGQLDPSAPATALERWVGWVTGYVRARVALALGARPTQVASRLLRARALLEVSPERIDVRFPLEESRVDVRLAGLDRDPGWIPAAGRSLAFHFE
jgi:hypothetical protein